MIAVPTPASFTPLSLPVGMRATRAVQALLSLLPAQPPEGWSEAAVEAALQQQGIRVNRVTVYRALDRLVRAGVLHRTVDAQRVGRYWVQGRPTGSASAHLECRACHQTVALYAEAAAVQAALHSLQQALSQATGVSNPMLDVTVQAECAQCAAEAATQTT